MIYTILTTLSCLALGFTPTSGTQIGIVGKMCNMGATMSNILWTLEQYPTTIRAEAIGLTQLLDKLGATSSAWIAEDLNEMYSGAAFLLLGGLGLVTVSLQVLLKDSGGMQNVDKLSDSGDMQNVDKLSDSETQCNDNNVLSYDNRSIDL